MLKCCNLLDTCFNFETILKLMTNSPEFLVWDTRMYGQKTCIQVTYTTIQLSCMRNMADDGDDDLSKQPTTLL